MQNQIRSRLTLAILVSLIPATAVLGQSQTSYYVSGEVRDEFGKIAKSVSVCAHSLKLADGPVRVTSCAQTGSNGKFILKLAKAGTYQVFANKTSAGYMPQNRPFYRHVSIPIQEVTLNDVSPNADVTLSLGPKSPTIVGKAVDLSTGLPIDNILITMCHADNPKTCFSINAKDANGTFEAFGPLVPFTLKIVAEGYENWWGLRGSDTTEQGISLSTGVTTQLDVQLRRRNETTNLAMNEAEKRTDTHLPAPKQLSPADEVVFEHYPRATRVKWSEIEGAVSYVLEVDYCDGLGRAKGKRECIDPQPLHPKLGIPGTSHEFLFVGAQPGRWRVWALDKEGREGFKSPWRNFFYTR